MKLALLFTTAAAASVLAAAPAMAAGIDGTWKVDTKNIAFPKKPNKTLLKDGIYYCGGCTPAMTTKADGKFHKISGQPYFDEVMIKVVDANTVEETDKKAGKVNFVQTMTVAADGKTRSYTFTDTTAENGVPVKGSGSSERVAKGPAGSHAISGEWRPKEMTDLSAEALTVTFKTAGNTLSMSSPTGTSYTATFGGPAVAIKGDPGKTMAAVKKAGGSIVETDSRDGKPVSVATLTPSADGKTLDVAVEDSVKKTTVKYKAMKQ